MNTSETSALPGWPAWRYTLVFLAMTAVLVCISWPFIATANHELGDFAANSLLIQDAKSSLLLHGNYSRVGFNHPGPAILYVLTAGEVVLYDWLHVVPSGLSGQLFAVAVYNAAWTVLLLALVRRIAGSTAGALLFMAVFLAMLGICDWRILTGLWFPHLYFMPFAVLVVCVSRLAWGKADMLIPLGFTSGVLINGHVAFVALIGIMLIATVAANYRLTRHEPALRILNRDYWRRHRRALLGCAGIVLLFLVPFFIACLVDRPTPVQEYIHFKNGNKGNSLGAAAGFVALYWGSGILALAGGVLTFLLYFAWRRRPGQAGRDGSALVLAIGAATLAVLYYAKVGVDMLDQTYIALFYYSAPCLAVALAVLYVYQAITIRRKQWLAVAVAVPAVAVCFLKIKEPPEYIAHYDQPLTATVYQELKKTQVGRQRIVLDLDDTREWGHIWTHIVGIESYAKRQHDDLFCINDNWHISFTKAARCRPEELDNPVRYFVQLPGKLDTLAVPAIHNLGLSFHRYQPGYSKPTILVVARHRDRILGMLRSGWAADGIEYTWTVGPDASLVVPVPAGYTGIVTLDAMALLPKDDSTQRATLFVNGKESGTFNFDRAGNRQQLPVRVDQPATDALTIELKIAAPVSPKSAGMSDDDRPLGVALYGLSY